jgi:hypothetical protein
VTTPQEIQEARAAMRSAYTLLRAEASYEYGDLIDALERSHENLIDAVSLSLAAFAQVEDDLRTEVLTRAAALMPAPDVPLRLVRDVFAGETVA